MKIKGSVKFILIVLALLFSIYIIVYFQIYLLKLLDIISYDNMFIKIFVRYIKCIYNIHY